MSEGKWGRLRADCVIADLAPEEIDRHLERWGLRRQPDMTYVAFRGLHFDRLNENNDGIRLAEGEKALWTAFHKPIDIEHGTVDQAELEASLRAGQGEDGRSRLVIGAVLGAEIADRATDPNLLALAGLWSGKFPREVGEFRTEFAAGRLPFSMETAFARQECDACGHVAAAAAGGEDLCEHLRARTPGTKPPTGRWAQEAVFAAFSKVRRPADAGAVAVALGSQHPITPGGPMDGKTYRQEEIDALCAVAEQKGAQGAAEKIAALEAKVAEMATASQAADAAATEEIERLEKDLEAAETKAAAAEKATADLTAAVARDRLVADRIGRAQAAGLTLPAGKDEAATALRAKWQAAFAEMSEDAFGVWLEAWKTRPQPTGTAVAGALFGAAGHEETAPTFADAAEKAFAFGPRARR